MTDVSYSFYVTGDFRNFISGAKVEVATTGYDEYRGYTDSNGAVTITFSQEASGVGRAWGVEKSGYASVVMNEPPQAVNFVTMHLLPSIYSNVTISVSGSGTTDPPVGNYAGTYLIGGSLLVTAYQTSGWLYDHMNRNGVPHTSANPGEFLNLQTAENIEVVFVSIGQATVTITIAGQGTTDPVAGAHQYDLGSTLTVSAMPATNWRYKHMSRNGGVWTEANPGEFLNLGEQENIEVVFEELPPNGVPSIPIIPIVLGGITALAVLWLVLKK